jgi:hypothetical protein
MSIISKEDAAIIRANMAVGYGRVEYHTNRYVQTLEGELGGEGTGVPSGCLGCPRLMDCLSDQPTYLLMMAGDIK